MNTELNRPERYSSGCSSALTHPSYRTTTQYTPERIPLSTMGSFPNTGRSSNPFSCCVGPLNIEGTTVPGRLASKEPITTGDSPWKCLDTEPIVEKTVTASNNAGGLLPTSVTPTDEKISSEREAVVSGGTHTSVDAWEGTLREDSKGNRADCNTIANAACATAINTSADKLATTITPVGDCTCPTLTSVAQLSPFSRTARRPADAVGPLCLGTVPLSTSRQVGSRQACNSSKPSSSGSVVNSLRLSKNAMPHASPTTNTQMRTSRRPAAPASSGSRSQNGGGERWPHRGDNVSTEFKEQRRRELYAWNEELKKKSKDSISKDAV
ncbi:unnamed protein product [Trypanosoma congolense IL3000]|uniref:WGS project CAEQ00000000 data, annotated contig 2393 n=1 Tax=Trypanosoma congolense (strain IL3000) TaxID=1068625 RepID=F9WDR8_TRYCI|nr:unnamed protein product [Trypanosoma congolense IL3000]